MPTLPGDGSTALGGVLGGVAVAVAIYPCLACGGSGIEHCCEGLREQALPTSGTPSRRLLPARYHLGVLGDGEATENERQPPPLGRFEERQSERKSRELSAMRAKTRAGSICRQPAMKNGRCRLHGGKSPAAPRGERNGNYRHGLRTIETTSGRGKEVAAPACLTHWLCHSAPQTLGDKQGMLPRTIVIALALIFSMSRLSDAQELRIGHLETKDDIGINWLNFHCNQSGGNLTCDVFQTLIMHKVEAKDRETKIQEKIVNNDDFQKNFGEICKHIDELISIGQNSLRTGRGADGSTINVRAAQEGLLNFNAIAAACKNPNSKTIRNFVELSVDHDIHTCRVINNYSRMTFSWDTATGMWLSKEGPIGPCGSVSIATLEKDKNAPLFWLYTEKTLWMNPDGQLINGLSCSQMRDRVMHYTWRAADNFYECTHIENSMMN